MAYYRVALSLGLSLLAATLAILYAAGIVLPGFASSGIWFSTALVAFAIFRAHRVPLLTLSRAILVFYLYVSAAFVWPVLFPGIFIAVHSTPFQTADIFASANHLVAIGLASMLAGWLLGFDLARRSKHRTKEKSFPVGPELFLAFVLIAVPLLIFSFPTESIFTVGYNGAARDLTVGANLEINVFKPALIICILLALVALLQRPVWHRWIFWSGLTGTVVVVLGFASGNRVEEIGCLLAIGWLLLSDRPGRRTPKAWIVLAAGLCVFMLVLGEVRNVFPSEQVDKSYLLDAAQRALQVVPQQDTMRMKPSTSGDIALTLCVVIGLVDTGGLQIDYGNTFLKYVDMTLPRFLNATRPVELQVFLQQHAMTQDGLFVLAEPYLAGGSLGVLLVLGMFGVACGFLEARFVTYGLTPWNPLFYLLLLSCVPRWFLYSIFTMYKHVLTGVVIFVVVKTTSYAYLRASERQQGLLPTVRHPEENLRPFSGTRRHRGAVT
jgi:hypothetical protein